MRHSIDWFSAMAVPTPYNNFSLGALSKHFRSFLRRDSTLVVELFNPQTVEGMNDKVIARFVNVIASEEGDMEVMMCGVALSSLNYFDGLFIMDCLEVYKGFKSRHHNTNWVTN